MGWKVAWTGAWMYTASLMLKPAWASMSPIIVSGDMKATQHQPPLPA